MAWNFKVLVTVDSHFPGEKGWPDDRYLRQGVRANGWVLLKQVPLGYEIWRQLNGFPPVTPTRTNKEKRRQRKQSQAAQSLTVGRRFFCASFSLSIATTLISN